VRTYASTYAFALQVRLRANLSGGNLTVTVRDRTVFDFQLGWTTELVAAANIEFSLGCGQHTRLSFLFGTDGTVSHVVLNPGP